MVLRLTDTIITTRPRHRRRGLLAQAALIAAVAVIGGVLWTSF